MILYFDFWSFYESFLQKLERINQNQVETQDKINTWTTTQAEHKRKKALLIGCNYRFTSYALYGCINDAKLMQNLLQEKFGFESLKLITDDTKVKPYKADILREIENLIQNAEENDILFIYFSGHGEQIFDRSGDELDGKDECYISLDFQKVIDDELYSIVKNNDKKVQIMFMFDCCHSGTIMDFPYRMFGNKPSIITDDLEASCICLSGCRDSQFSYESQIGRLRHGALTYYFDRVVRSFYGPFTYQFLMNKIQDSLNISRFDQNAQLSSNTFRKWSTDRFMLF